ncbi:binary toxin-like calcium binding domain-containing protein [Bacillus cereus]|uniref:binary toxin-like calcium binding domain-containing protein n=1 Tax=Bacillus cereus TaxID=1396 RepID=UPI000BEE47C8|nr:binary toxin-like calcium binding domain-containing protein [Bacillus cereus]PEA06361.1 iota toxin protein Ib [Bacillus cereus]
MYKNNIMKCVVTTTLCSQLLTYSNTSYAEEKKPPTNIQQEMQSEKDSQVSNDLSQGLLGYYFHDPKFQQLALMAHRQASDLEISKDDVKQLLSKEQQHIQSVRWLGYIQPPETGDYVLSTSSDQQVVIELDGKTIVNQTSMTEPIQLEKDNLYKIRIEYVPEDTKEQENLLDFQLNWSISGAEIKPIPENAFHLPDLSRKQDQEKIIPETNLFQEQGEAKKVSRSKRSLATNPLLDTDDDGIYDEWETEGYTIQRQIAVKWDDSMKDQDYTKYVSNPYNSHTVGDPYTDWEKAVGRIDYAVKTEARNPLVAAYPTVGVHMERLIVSEKQNISTGLGKTVSASMSASNTAAITAGIDATAGTSLLGPSGSVTAHFSYTESSIATVEDSSSRNWSQDLGIDTGQSAYLNANVRYYNTGTAPIYNVKPTTNFVLDGESIVTVKAKENQLGNVLKAGGEYPEKHLHPIALNTLDDFGSQLIPINYNQTKRLENGNKLTLETTQASGLYGKIKANGGLNVDPSQEWEPVRAQIDNVTAGIVLDTGEETLERRVAARDTRNPEDLTPEITIGEAIKIAFDTTETEGKLYYKDTPLSESLVGLVFDDSTAREIKTQLDNTPEQEKKIYNVKLKRGMNIMIKKPIWYSDFDEKQHNWTNVTLATGEGVTGNAGKISKGANWDASLKYKTLDNYRELKPNTQYKLSASVRYPNLWLGRLTGAYIGTNISTPAEYVIQSNRYERIERIFASGSNPDHITDLLIETSSTQDMLFDDITLVELGPSPFGKVRAHFSANGRSITYNFQSALPGVHRFEIYMNGGKKSNLDVDLLVFGLNLTTHTKNLNISPEEATNPSNTFEIRFKGDPLVTFKGSNR